MKSYTKSLEAYLVSFEETNQLVGKLHAAISQQIKVYRVSFAPTGLDFCSHRKSGSVILSEIKV